MSVRQLDARTVTALVADATAAPSMHNAQPWRFRYVCDAHTLLLHADLTRAMHHTDPGNRSLHIGCGAALFNLRVAAAHAGLPCTVHLLPDPADPQLLASVHFTPAEETGPPEPAPPDTSARLGTCTPGAPAPPGSAARPGTSAPAGQDPAARASAGSRADAAGGADAPAPALGSAADAAGGGGAAAHAGPGRGTGSDAAPATSATQNTVAPAAPAASDAPAPGSGADAAVGASASAAFDDRGDTEDLRSLYPAIALRHTSRYPFEERDVPEDVRGALVDAAEREGAELLFAGTWHTEAVLELVRDAESRDAIDPAAAGDLARWTRRGPDAGAAADGVPEYAFGPRPRDGRSPLRDFAGRRPVPDRGGAAFERHPHLALLSTYGDTPADWLLAGQALERVLLRATGAGLATSLTSHPLERGDLRMLARDPVSGLGHVQMVLRLGYGPAGPATPRRPVAEVLEVTQRVREV